MLQRLSTRCRVGVQNRIVGHVKLVMEKEVNRQGLVLTFRWLDIILLSLRRRRLTDIRRCTRVKRTYCGITCMQVSSRRLTGYNGTESTLSWEKDNLLQTEETVDDQWTVQIAHGGELSH